MLMEPIDSPQNSTTNLPQPEIIPTQPPNLQNETGKLLIASTIIFLFLISLTSAGYLSYQNYKLQQEISNLKTSLPTPTPTINANKQQDIYYLSDFSVQFPSNYIYGEISGKPITRLSNFENFDVTNGPCYKITGISLLTSHRLVPDIKEDLSPSLSITAWNSEKISFRSDDVKTTFYNIENNLRNLDKYTNIEYLKSEDDKPLLSLEGFLFCSGGFSELAYLQKVETSKFEKAYYAEIFEGNDSVSTPSKKLIIKNKNSWLIVSESHQIPNEKNKAFSQCFSSEDQFKCGQDVWLGIRDDAESKKWINSMLSSINLSTQQ